MSGAADPSIDRWLAGAHEQVVVGEDDGARYGLAQPSPSGWGSPPPHADDRHQSPAPPRFPSPPLLSNRRLCYSGYKLDSGGMVLRSPGYLCLP